VNVNVAVAPATPEDAAKSPLSSVPVSAGVITCYVEGTTGPTSRLFEGDAEIDGAPGTYTVEVADNGEPGRNTDTFGITLSTGYAAAGTLAAGNIQLHGSCP
jgi:hypothetical protein